MASSTGQVMCPPTHTCIKRTTRDKAIQAFIEVKRQAKVIRSLRTLQKSSETTQAKRIQVLTEAAVRRVKEERDIHSRNLVLLGKTHKSDITNARGSSLRLGLVIGAVSGVVVGVGVTILIVYALNPKIFTGP